MQDTELLQFIHKTARMGEESLRDIEPMVKENELYSAISSQIREYKCIAGCANRMLEERGEMSPDPSTFSKVSSGVMTAMKMMIWNIGSISSLMVRSDSWKMRMSRFWRKRSMVRNMALTAVV